MEERRARSLTDADIAAISEAVSKRATCSLGLTPADTVTIKAHLRLWNKATGIIGSVILTAIAVLLVGIFTKGFWASLTEGIHK